MNVFVLKFSTNDLKCLDQLAPSYLSHLLIHHQGHYVRLIRNYRYSPSAILKHITSETMNENITANLKYAPIIL